MLLYRIQAFYIRLKGTLPEIWNRDQDKKLNFSEEM